MMYRIMLVDDEENILNALRRVLVLPISYEGKEYPLQAEIFTSPYNALRRAEETAFDLVVSDYRMPDMNGVQFLTALRKIQPQTARIILSGYTDLDALLGAINEAQIFRFIPKPWQDYDLKVAIAQALAYRNLLLENQRLADLVRVQQGKLSQQEHALRRLEEESPGITKVNWGPNGEVIFDEEA
jgi:two-component system probable response regulator PhcQ